MKYPEGFVPQAPTLTGPGCFSTQVLVPDTMIGSILGRGGRALTELQMLSGTRIRISQRGEYMPGTRSRIVTIRGPTAQTVWQAQYMMSQRIILPPTATASGGGGSPAHPPRSPSQKQRPHHHAPTATSSSAQTPSSAPPPPPPPPHPSSAAGAAAPSSASGGEAGPVSDTSASQRSPRAG